MILFDHKKTKVRPGGKWLEEDSSHFCKKCGVLRKTEFMKKVEEIFLTINRESREFSWYCKNGCAPKYDRQFTTAIGMKYFADIEVDENGVAIEKKSL